MGTHLRAQGAVGGRGTRLLWGGPGPPVPGFLLVQAHLAPAKEQFPFFCSW